MTDEHMEAIKRYAESEHCPAYDAAILKQLLREIEHFKRYGTII